jgi:hypothetical protein
MEGIKGRIPEFYFFSRERYQPEAEKDLMVRYPPWRKRT